MAPRSSQETLRDVSCRAVEPLLRVLKENEIPLVRLTEGLEVTPEQLSNLNERISWSSFALLHDRMAQICGGLDEWERAGARLQEVPSLLPLMRAISLFASAKDVYWAGTTWITKKLFPVLESELIALGPTTTRIISVVPAPYRVSEAFFRFTAGTFQAAPRLIGQADAMVTTRIDGRRCEWTMEHAPSMTIFARIRHAFHAVFAAKRVFAELREQNEELHQKLRELSDARQVAESASRVRTQFIANVGHELRTPLNGVIGLTELLLDTRLTPQQTEYAEALRTSASSLNRLVGGVLDFSDIQGGRLDMDEHEVDVRSLLREIETFARERTQPKNLTFKLIADEGIPAKIRGSTLRIRQVLQNLVDNAIKFTEKGSITVRTAIDRDDRGRRFVAFHVIDTGIGIPEDWQANLFHAFVQKDGSFTRAAGGTGLGLAIAQQLALLMSGRILVASTVGHGSTFSLEIPLDPIENAGELEHLERPAPKQAIARIASRVPPAPAAAPSEPLPKAAQPSLRVLVVEDNLVNQKVLVRHLEKLGCSVDVAQNGLEAVQITEQNTYAVVFMDLQMPVMDGFEATSRIRAREGNVRHTPIIAVTAHVEEQFVLRAREAGIDEHLGKPIQRDSIASALQRSIGPQLSLSAT